MRKATPLGIRILKNVVIQESGCFEWTLTRDKGGYGRIKLSNNGVKTMGLAHRVSYEAFNGPIPDGLWVLHKCHNPCCVNPYHLYAGDRFQNARDMVEAGRSLVGSRQKTFKRTDELIGNVNKLRREGYTRRAIIAELGIGGRTYDRIKHDGLIDHEANRQARVINHRAARMRQLGR